MLLHLAARFLKAFFPHSKRKEVRSSAQIFNLSFNDTQDWIEDCKFCNRKGCKKLKNNKFFLKKIRCFFYLCKIFPTQTSNLAVCLGINVTFAKFRRELQGLAALLLFLQSTKRILDPAKFVRRSFFVKMFIGF